MQWNQTSEQVSVMMAVMPHFKDDSDTYKDVTCVQWSPNGAFLATGCYDGVIRVWNSDGTLFSSLEKHEGPVFSIKWSKDGKLILSGGNDRKANVWDHGSQTLLKSYLLHTAQVVDVDWSDSDMFATSSSDRS